VLNVAKLKHFYKNVEKSEDEEGDTTKFNQSDDQASTDFNDIFNQARNDGPLTRAKAK